MKLAPKLKYGRNVFYAFIVKVCFYYKPLSVRAHLLILDCATSCLLEIEFLFQGFL